jgi:radical SAM/Cys-rich protein
MEIVVDTTIRSYGKPGGRAMVTFEKKLSTHGKFPLNADRVDTLQVNMGKLCNQSCNHCHVEAGPNRTEVMSRKTVDGVLNALRHDAITSIDITGGAPEMNPHFEYFVETGSSLGKHITVRSNLTVYLEEGKDHLPDFLKKHRVEIIASLPCYLQKNIDAQRGKGAAEKSIAVLRRLNDLGYGKPETGLVLNLVYNPGGPSLPPLQQTLEADYKRELERRYGVFFNSLYTITNVPIGRFKTTLSASGALEGYMKKLDDAFNPQVVDSLMCRNLVSVGWDGTLFDCDFNQMLSLPVVENVPHTIDEFELESLAGRKIAIGDHCYACTAGAGSSCGGSILDGVTVTSHSP